MAKKVESIILKLLFSSEKGIDILPDFIVISYNTFCAPAENENNNSMILKRIFILIPQ